MDLRANVCTLVCTDLPPNTLTFDLPLHTERTRLATFVQLPSGNWRVQIRRKGRYVSESFRRQKDAQEWALDAERRIDRGETPSSRAKIDPATFGDLIDLHLEDLKEVGRTTRRSKTFCLGQLRENLDNVRLGDLDRERLIKYGRGRARNGAGPVTLSIDFTFIKTLIAHAAAVHGIQIGAAPFPESPRFARDDKEEKRGEFSSRKIGVRLASSLVTGEPPCMFPSCALSRAHS